MRAWLRRRQGHRALSSWVQRPRQDLAAELGRDGRGLDHVQRILGESLQRHRSATAALDHTRLVLDHLQQDRDLMAEALLAARAEVRRHHPVGFEPSLLAWCDD